jgi:hypothetical protein
MPHLGGGMGTRHVAGIVSYLVSATVKHPAPCTETRTSSEGTPGGDCFTLRFRWIARESRTGQSARDAFVYSGAELLASGARSSKVGSVLTSSFPSSRTPTLASAVQELTSHTRKRGRWYPLIARPREPLARMRLGVRRTLHGKSKRPIDRPR